jgi:hypothetical protein
MGKKTELWRKIATGRVNEIGKRDEKGEDGKYR